MSFKIHSVGELTVLVEKLGLKVNSTEELNELLQAANRSDDPEAGWQETVKSIGFLVPAIALGVATIVSIVLISQIKKADIPMDILVAGMGIVWGGAVAICVPAVGFALFLLGRSRPASKAAEPSGPSGPFQARLADRFGQAFTTGKDS